MRENSGLRSYSRRRFTRARREGLVDVFELDRSLIGDYERFARSFTRIRASDLRQQIDEIYATRRFWPEPLITVNPDFERGASIDDLVADGSLLPETARVFRIDDKSIELYRHQSQAIAKAVAGQSFVVTTGTGSGKSLCFFLPIIDVRCARATTGEARPAGRAIVVYPMNALANSQIEETSTRILNRTSACSTESPIANSRATPARKSRRRAATDRGQTA